MKSIITLTLLVILTMRLASSQNPNQLIPFASGLSNIVCIANAGDNRLFIANQQGYISIVDPDGTVRSPYFLDIHHRVKFGGEQGLLGIAFHPQYKTNGYLYVNYIGKRDSTHISRFKVDTDNPNVIDTLSEFNIITIHQPYPNHNGGDLNFGPDGYLYFGLGDGGAGGDPENRAQNPKEYLGKLHRIDVDHGNPYAIPETNPFYNDTTTLGEIWALGLRNPWRFSFDRLTGDLWIADVGQNKIEEIDFQAAGDQGGENYGWKCYEGDEIYYGSNCISNTEVTFPIYSYPHGDECSVTGGYVYRGKKSSPFYGHYFFADYCSDRIWTLHLESGNWITEDFGQFTGNNFSTFGEDSIGNLYIAGVKSGKIFKIDDLTSGIHGTSNSIGMTIIQNSSNYKVRILNQELNPSALKLNVYDMNGRKLYSTKINTTDFEFDFNFLPAGAFILSVNSGKNIIVQKLIVTK